MYSGISIIVHVFAGIGIISCPGHALNLVISFPATSYRMTNSGNLTPTIVMYLYLP